MATKFGPPPNDSKVDINDPRWRKWFYDIWAASGTGILPAVASPPTTAPTNIPPNSVACVIDTTNSKLWAYIGGTWKGVTLT